MIKILKNDLQNNKKSYKKIIALSFVILLCVSIISIFGFTLNYLVAEEDYKNSSSNFLPICGGKNIINDTKFIKKIKNIDGINETIFTSHILNLFGFTNDTPVDIHINGSDRNISLKKSCIFEYYDKLPKALKNEFKIKNPNKNLFKYGRMYENKEEFVCTENFLNNLGIDSDKIESKLDNMFTIKVSDTNYLTNAKLVGVVDDSLLNLSTYNQGSINVPTLFIPLENMIFNESSMVYLNAYLDSSISKHFVEKEIEKFLPSNYMIAKGIPNKSVKVMFDCKVIAFNIVLGIGIIIIVASLYNIFKMLLSNNKAIYENENFNKKEKRKFTTLQIFAINFIVFLAVIILGIAWLYMFNAIVTAAAGISYGVNFNIYGIMVGITALSSLVINIALQALINLKN